MDAFEIISEEFASTIGTSDPADTKSKRERSAMQSKLSLEGLPAAHIDPASIKRRPKTISGKSKRGQQASEPLISRTAKPAGTRDTEGRTADDTRLECALGCDEGAHHERSIHGGSSPLVAQAASGRARNDAQECVAVSGDEGARPLNGHPDLASPLVSEITQLWRMRQRWHRAEKSLILQGKAVCRAWTAGNKDEADQLYKLAASGKASEPVVGMALMPFLSAQDGFAKERAALEKRLRVLAQSSDFWPWVKQVSGFGPLNLAAVIGEAGDIAGYRNPSCLWKRMGLAVIDGSRQRKVSDAEKALMHGYSPARRCVAYLLGDTLIKSGDKCRYRAVYAGRREHTAGTHPDWSKAHSHNDASRYMVKRVLRELWSEARRLRRESLEN